MRMFQIFVLSILSVCSASAWAQTESLSNKSYWDALKNYQYGDSREALLALEEGFETVAGNEIQQNESAAQLAGILSEDATAAGRQFAALQLRLLGSSREIPALKEAFQLEGDADSVRAALEAIPGDEASAALREMLLPSEGKFKCGLMDSLSKRRDVAAIPQITEAARSEDAQVRTAAVRSLAKYGSDALEPLSSFECGPENMELASARLSVAYALSDEGKSEEARRIYEETARSEYPNHLRFAALNGLLNLLPEEERDRTVADWFSGDDPLRIKTAAGFLGKMTSGQFEELFARRSEFPLEKRLILFSVSDKVNTKEIRDELIQTLSEDAPEMKVTAIRMLGESGDFTLVPVLIPFLGAKNASLADAATEAFLTLPRDEVARRLMEALQTKSDIPRAAAVDLLARMKYYPALEIMEEQARSEDAEIHDVAIDGLANLCSTAPSDVDRFAELYVYAARHGYRDRVERAFAQLMAPDDEADIKVIHAMNTMEKMNQNDRLILFLPLLGKIGGEKTLALIKKSMSDSHPGVRSAALRGFCNWPDASHADELKRLFETSKDRSVRQMALRAYVRVVTQRGERTEEETLSMIQSAMSHAEGEAERKLIVQRSAEIRSMETVRWLVQFLQNEELSENACESIVKLAHHRFLREPNKAEFFPILEKVEQTARGEATREAAKKARLGM